MTDPLGELQVLTARTHEQVQVSLDCIERAEALLVRLGRRALVRERVEMATRSRPPGLETSRLAPVLPISGPMRPVLQSRLELLAAAYELDPASVARDARVLSWWTVPVDEFVAWVGRLHGWDAGTATVYLGALRSAEQSDNVGCPWLEDGA